MVGISRRHSKHGRGLGHRHILSTIGRPALRLATVSAATEVMGFLHMYADARMPIWGASAILSNILLVLFSRSGQRWLYGVSLFTLLVFLIVYNRLSKPINQVHTEAAKSGRNLENGRELQTAWDRSLIIAFRCSWCPCSPNAWCCSYLQPRYEINNLVQTNQLKEPSSPTRRRNMSRYHRTA